MDIITWDIMTTMMTIRKVNRGSRVGSGSSASSRSSSSSVSRGTLRRSGWLANSYFIRLWERSRGWRTIMINLILAIGFTVAEMINYLAGVDWKDFINEKWAPWIVVSINILNIALREDTTGPSGIKRWRNRK